RRPGRVEGQVDVRALDAWQARDLGLDVVGEDLAHAAARRGQGHRDLDDLAAAARLLADLAAVDEAEVDDVDGDLGVVAGPELLPDLRLLEVGGVGLADLRLGRDLVADRGRVCAV